jgi:MFS superfamily sulfate permease-like transporter
VLFRWDAPLFFANAEFFHDRVRAAVASSPTPVRWLVVAAEPVTSIDVTAADALCDLDDSLRRRRYPHVFRGDEGSGPGKTGAVRDSGSTSVRTPSFPPSRKRSARFLSGEHRVRL